MDDDIWMTGRSVWLTSFWGWTPETWGAVGFTNPGRRRSVESQTTDPFIMVIYVTKSAPGADSDILGMVTGFYLVSHVEGDRDDFTDRLSHHGREPAKWRHSLQALRAFTFLPEYRLHVEELDPTIGPRARAVAAFGEPLDEGRVQKLLAIPFVEVPVFGATGVVDGDIQIPGRGGHKVKAGPANRSGYSVPGEPPDTEKELYALILKGDTSAFLGEPAADRHIFKIGLSLSPKTRLDVFNRSLPKGAYSWLLHRSTRLDGDDPYPTFEAAEAGENAMKDCLGADGQWLGAEFYAASNSAFERAWASSRKVALDFVSRG